MSRATYGVQLFIWDTRKIMAIVDHNFGCSVTNDIENVVKEIGIVNEVDPNECIIVYCDSEGYWDGWDNTKQSFVILGCKTLREALRKYLLINTKNEQNATQQ